MSRNNQIEKTLEDVQMLMENETQLTADYNTIVNEKHELIEEIEELKRSLKSEQLNVRKLEQHVDKENLSSKCNQKHEEEIKRLNDQLQKLENEKDKLQHVMSENKLEANNQQEKSKREVSHLKLELQYERENSSRIKEKLRRLQSNQTDSTICLKSSEGPLAFKKSEMIDKNVMTDVIGTSKAEAGKSKNYLDDEQYEKLLPTYEKGKFYAFKSVFKELQETVI